MNHSSDSSVADVKHPILVLISVLLAGIILSLSFWTIQQQLQKYPLEDVIHSIAAIPGQSIGLAIALTALNYFILTSYDTLAVRFVRHPLPYRKTALVAAISYGISNTVGFALLSDSAIRYRFYSRWSFSAKEVAQIVAFCHLTFWLGLFTIGGAIFLINPPFVPGLLNLPFNSAYVVGGVFLAIVSAYLIWNWAGNQSIQIGKWTLPHIPFHLSLIQIAVTSLNWMIAVMVLYVLLPTTASLSYFSFFSIYLLAQLTSILSSVPGGLGVFESVLLLLLSSEVNSAALPGALLAYRGIHYFLPLVMAVFGFGFYELRQRLAPAS